MIASPIYTSNNISSAIRQLRGLGVSSFMPLGFETDDRVWDANMRFLPSSTEVVSGNGSVFNRSRILNPSIANRLRISRGFSDSGQVGALFGGARIELLSDGKTVFDVSTTGWTDSGAPTYTANTDVAPDDTTTADSINDDQISTHEQIFYDITVAADTVIRVCSLFIKKTVGASSHPALTLVYFTPTAVQTRAILNTNTGVATVDLDTGTSGIFGVESYGNYWRLWIAKANSNSNTVLRMSFAPALSTDGTTANVAATGTSVIWGSQVTVGNIVSSYIFPAAGTRAADDVRYDNTGGIIVPATKGSIGMLITPGFSGAEIGTNVSVFDALVAGNDDGTRLFITAAGKFECQIRSASSFQAILTSTTVVEKGRTYWVVCTQDTDDFRLSIDGVEEASDVSGSLPTAVNSTFYLAQSNVNTIPYFGMISYIVSGDRVWTLGQQQDIGKQIIQPTYPGHLRLQA